MVSLVVLLKLLSWLGGGRSPVLEMSGSQEMSQRHRIIHKSADTTCLII